MFISIKLTTVQVSITGQRGHVACRWLNLSIHSIDGIFGPACWGMGCLPTFFHSINPPHSNYGIYIINDHQAATTFISVGDYTNVFVT
jgi:hypothetical protein